MRKNGNRLVTVGKVTRQLEKLLPENQGFDIACWLPDGTTCCVVGSHLDDEGDVCIELEEEGDDGGYFDVEILLEDLRSYETSAGVYLKGCGYYLAFDADSNGIIFIPDDDEEIVGSYVESFGTYREIIPSEMSDWERRCWNDEHPTQSKESKIETAVLVLILIGIFGFMVYQIWKLAHAYTFRAVVWLIVCIFLLSVGGLSLYYSVLEKRK